MFNKMEEQVPQKPINKVYLMENHSNESSQKQLQRVFDCFCLKSVNVIFFRAKVFQN